MKRGYRLWLGISCAGALLSGEAVIKQKKFMPLPDMETLVVALPSPNRAIMSNTASYCASTRANPDYGKPGWTRDCGNRFHRGCDVVSVNLKATGKTTRVRFTDCSTDTEYESEEPTFIPSDPVFSIYAGEIKEAVTDENASDFGKHVVVKHAWPTSKQPFFTLYGHLSEVHVKEGELVERGQRIGTMGTTSRIVDARNWMSIAPHVHFEVWDHDQHAYDPLRFLKMYWR